MPTSIFDIDINDDKFKKLVEEMAKYKRAVDALPGAWGKVEDAVADVEGKQQEKTEAAESGTDEIEAQNEALEDQAGKVDKVTDATEKAVRANKKNAQAVKDTNLAWGTASRWTAMAVKDANSLLGIYGRISGKIADGAMGLAKWATIGGLGMGLIGAGGLWGINGLANSASATRRSSQGLGLTGGELRSFEVNYDKMFDARSVLGNIASARTDPDRMWALHSMGLNPQATTGEIAAQIPMRAKQIYAEGNQSASYAKARGLMEFFSEDDLRRLHAMTEQEIQDAVKRAAADKRQMEVSDQLRQRWQALAIQFNRASEVVENLFLRVLGPLAPEIEKLSDAFTEAVKTALSLDVMREAINWLARGIRTAGEYIGSGDFIEDIKKFGSAVQQVWEAIARAARWINGLFTSTSEAVGAGPTGVPYRQESGAPASPHYQTEHFETPEEAQRRYRRWAFAGFPDTDRVGRRVGTEGYDPVSAAEVHANLPEGLLDRIWQQESGRGRNMGPSSAGARGHFQFMPATGRQYGLMHAPEFGRDDFADLGKSSAAAGRYMSDLLTQFRGDLAKAAAGYNWGPANVQRAVAAHGDNWREHIPDETKKYLAAVVDPILARLREERLARERQGQQPPRVELRIENVAGAQVAVTGQAARVQ